MKMSLLTAAPVFMSKPLADGFQARSSAGLLKALLSIWRPLSGQRCGSRSGLTADVLDGDFL